jgi:hypothetical protein
MSQDYSNWGSDDYWTLDTGDLDFYYGYEYAHILGTRGDGDEETPWGFVLREKDSKRVIYHATAEEIGCKDARTTEEAMLTCLVHLMRKGVLKVQE